MVIRRAAEYGCSQAVWLYGRSLEGNIYNGQLYDPRSADFGYLGEQGLSLQKQGFLF
jgi:hypothetical protein